MNLSFERAVESDCKIIQTIMQEAIDTTKGLYIADTKDEEVFNLIQNSNLYVIAEGEIEVGIISYKVEDSNKVYLEELVIRPEYKGKGYGNQSIEWLINHLKNVSQLTLVTHPYNTPAIRLYLKHGFRIEGWKDNYFGDGEPRILLINQKS